MSTKCDFCNTEMEEGYQLEDSTTVMCHKCMLEEYGTEENYLKAYENGEVFWTTFYDED